MSALQTEFARHASVLELHVELLMAGLPSEQRVALAERYRSAKLTGSTRPPPHAPDEPPGNRLVDSVAAVVDHIRDALNGQT